MKAPSGRVFLRPNVPITRARAGPRGRTPRTYENGQATAWPRMSRGLKQRGSALLRRRRQRNRGVRKGMQIIDDVGALAVLLDAGKAHRGARDETLGVGDELIEVLVAPLAALGLHRGREIEPASFALLVADDPVQI